MRQNILYRVLKGMILSEVINIMNVYVPSNTAATFMKKDTIGHAKRNTKNANTRRLQQICLNAAHVIGGKVVFIQQFFPHISQEMYVFPRHEKIQLRNWENEKV